MRAALAMNLVLFAGSLALAAPPLRYPDAPTVDQTDDYHGTKVKDPYRWLEEYTPQTLAWIEAETKLTQDYLAKVPQHDAIQKRLTELWNYEKYSLPEQEGGYYFYTRNDGLQNQAVLYVLPPTPKGATNPGEPRVLLDPNTLSADGTIALSSYSPTRDGKLLAYALSEAGSDWITWKVRSVETGKDLDDVIKWSKFSGASWTPDGKGFYYSRFDAPPEGQQLKTANEYHKIFFHTLGEPQSKDRLVYERKDQPKWSLGASVTDDGRYLIIGVEPFELVENGLFYRDLSKPDAPVVELLNKFDAQYSFVGNDGPIFYVKSDLDAPRGRLWAIDIREPQREKWKEVIPQGRDPLDSVSLVGDRFFCTYLQDVKTAVKLFDLSGKPAGSIEMPEPGSAFGFGGRREDRETFYTFTSLTRPMTIYRYDITEGKATVFRQPKVPFNPDDYTSEQIFATSKDGTRVPMFISYRKGMQRDGANPTLLYGYGGFNISSKPYFSAARVGWMEMGGVFALAILRGGGEYGEEWHRAGMKLKKQNVFDDFIGAAEYLVKEQYTTPKRLAIKGGSNGGLLVGACVNQRPELFGAALPGVGVMDMLRFPKFTIGAAWIGEYGSPENAEEFKALYAYSPYHTIRSGVCYPPVLVTTADHDDRVYPAHSFKYAAALQAAQAKVENCENPILIRIETRAGHGAGKPTKKYIEEAADEYTFLVKSLGMNPKLP